MKNLNTQSDVEEYLKSGEMTRPFLRDEFVKEKVYKDYNFKKQTKPNASPLLSLASWVKANVKYCDDKDFSSKNKFGRTAKQVWESKIATGCTDYAIVFATLARQLGYATTLLHTAEEEWVKSLKNGEKSNCAIGHSFCECFDKEKGKWVLVDPTCREIVEDYDAERLFLPYDKLGHKVYLPYFRGKDLGEVQNIKSHNAEMERACKQL